MDDDGFVPSSAFENLSGAAMDLDFMDELLFDGCWLETSDGLNFSQPGPSNSGASSLSSSFQYFPFSEPNPSQLNVNPQHQIHQQDTDKKFPENSLLVYPKVELVNTYSQTEKAALSTASCQLGNFPMEGSDSSRRWWIAPSAYPGPSSSVKDRLMLAIGCLKEWSKDLDVLIQIWVPIKKEGRHVLTTKDQPYFLNPDCKDLASYRNVSKTYDFPAEEDTKESVGLPGRVFLQRLPEWTPDVCFFRSDEYPRVAYAHQYNVRGSLALPVFEQGSGTCLGVVEIITTTQKINYRPELENVCKALEAFDLRSSQNFATPKIEPPDDSCQPALPNIAEVLESICKTHKLPLALTWAPCLQQRKSGCWHPEEKYSHCISMVDSACFVANEEFSGFREACSEHELFRGQGIVGRAFMTKKQCFAPDITAFSKTIYPLSHHARVFELRAAVAIPLRSTYTELAEFVVEFFLPKDCQDIEEQKRIVNSLAIDLRRVCPSLNVIMDKELEEEVIIPVMEVVVPSNGGFDNKETPNLGLSCSTETSLGESSWISHMMEAQQKGKGVSISWEFERKEWHEKFRLMTDWDSAIQQNSGLKRSANGGSDPSSLSGRPLLDGKRIGERRRTKTEKTISLQVLRQYFSGSLKDAAKSIGVCPTTLKRICRQHGITRWPSRKLKKVGHSLKKLQLVIDSVQGAAGAIQIESFYANFPELSSPNFSGHDPFSSSKICDQSKQLENPQSEGGLFSQGATASKSPSSSCSQSSGSSICCSAGTKQQMAVVNASSSEDALMVGNPSGMIKRARSEFELHMLVQEEPKLLTRSQSHKTLGERLSLQTLPPLPKGSGRNFKVKATFGEVKIRFSLQPNWGFREVQQEIAKRFSIDDFSGFQLKYLDDDHEWVLLTCDADLEECIDIYKSSQSHTIKISLHRASQMNLGLAFGRSTPP